MLSNRNIYFGCRMIVSWAVITRKHINRGDKISDRKYQMNWHQQDHVISGYNSFVVVVIIFYLHSLRTNERDLFSSAQTVSHSSRWLFRYRFEPVYNSFQHVNIIFIPRENFKIPFWNEIAVKLVFFCFLVIRFWSTKSRLCVVAT